MKVGGWRTDSVQALDIINERDLHEAAAALDRKHQSQISHTLPAEEKQPKSKQQQDATIQ
jgi:hypothetical protein